MKKKLLKIFMIIAILFIAYNAIWFAWSRSKYGKLSEGMEENSFSNFITPRYIYAEDGYDYLVKYPGYLSFTGNLSIGLPATNDNPFTDALIIWPKVGGKYEFGALLYEKDETGKLATEYQIYIDANGNALSGEYQEIVEKHKDSIQELFAKADERWNIFD